MENVRAEADRCMQLLLSAGDTAAVRRAEEGLDELAALPGFAAVLLAYLEPSTPQVPRPVRRLSAILLRRSVIARHWRGAVGTSEVAPGLSFELPPADKAAIRSRLPPLLGDPDGSVRSLIAAALGELGCIEWPGAWPGFLDGLQALIAAAARAPPQPPPQLADWLSADGALRCLGSVLSALRPENLPAVAAALAHPLLAIAGLSGDVGGGAFVAAMRVRSFDCLLHLIEQLSLARESDGARSKRVVRDLLQQRLAAPLLSTVGAALATPGWHPQACERKHAALCCLNALLYNFANVPLVLASLPQVCAHIVGFAARAARELVRVDVDGGSAEEMVAAATGSGGIGDLDGFMDAGVDEASVCGPTALLIAFAQFVMNLNASTVRAANRAMREQMPLACCVLLASCQLTEVQLESWGESPSAYVSDEADDSNELTLRLEVQTTLRDAFEGTRRLERATVSAVTATCTAALAAVASDAAAGSAAAAVPRIAAALSILAPLFSTQRWKVAEAAIFVIGSVSGEWLAWREASADSAPVAATAAATVDSLLEPEGLATSLVQILESGGRGLVHDTQLAQRSPYLLGRALWCAARLAAALPERASAGLITWSVEGLLPSHPMPIRMAACVSLARLLRCAPEDVVEAQGALIFERVGLLLSSAEAAPTTVSDDGEGEASSTHYLVDLIVKTIAFAPRAAGACESRVAPLLIEVWLQHTKDPLLCPQIAAALQLLSRHDDAAVADATSQRLAPILRRVLEEAAVAAEAELAGAKPAATDTRFPSGLVDAALGLLRSFVDRACGEASAGGTGGAAGAGYVAVPAGLVPLLLAASRLLAATDDATLVASCARILLVSARAFGPAFVSGTAAGDVGGAVLSAPLLGACFGRLLRPELLSDSAVQPAGPLAVAVLRHLLPALPREAPQHLVSGLCGRLASARLPATLQALSCAVAVAIVDDQDAACPVLVFLRDMLVALPAAPSAAARKWDGFGALVRPGGGGCGVLPALTVWARSVADIFDLVARPQPRRLLAAAATRVLGFRSGFAQLSGVRVAGVAMEAEAAPAGAVHTRTRSRRALAGKVLADSTVTLAVKLLAKVAAGFVLDCEAADAGAEEDADDGCDEDDEDDEDEEDEEDDEGEGGVGAGAGEEGEDASSEESAVDAAAAGLGRGRGARKGPSPFVNAAALRGLVDFGDEEDEGCDADGGQRIGGVALARLFSTGNSDHAGANADTIDGVDDSDEQLEEADPLGLGDAAATSAEPLARLLREPAAAAAAGADFFGGVAAAAAAGDAAAAALLAAAAAQLARKDRAEVARRVPAAARWMQ